ncbi:3-dehydroquinate synthase [Vagococcus sp. BWB3-3]|uniref:3-dehydroquinate synthase n=1 Tax=Vagococcus allomyrinae TaxID=2794353 RepID=A0A940PDY1_9ENTE|nr:3-dehydroquinate synthase [Vagococcus allomyrinae]MBP1041736.1 3-dehydroquinate synthase [Vagococcus allomyrinae]
MKLTVTLPRHRYDLTIGAGVLANVGQWVSSLWQPQRVMVITDETVQQLYAEQVLKALRQAGFTADAFAVPAGETSKSLTQAEELYDWLASQGMTRKDGIIALGGGVVGDLTGFVASTFMRGLHFLQIPTTLLAQVDSSIGGKTAVNTASAKNLVGTFAQPDGVLIDTETLKTLEPRRVREGIAEIVKSAAIADIALWTKLSGLKDEHELLENAEEIIAACCKVKRRVVEEDEFDTGQRLILNFGHTIGHGIENTAGYGVVTHGEAVAIGMVQISRVAESKGLMPLGTTAQLSEMLLKFNLPITTEYWSEEAIFKALTHDKKTAGSDIRIILLEKIGQAKIVTIATDEMKEFLIRQL